MKIDQSSFFLPGNVHARPAVIHVTSEEAAGQTVDPQAIRRLRRALAFMRPTILNFGGWRRLRRTETAWPAAAVAEVLAVIVQRYVVWPVAYTNYRPAAAEAEAGTGADQKAPAPKQAQGTAIFQTSDPQIGLPAAQAGFAITKALIDGVQGGQLRRTVQRELRAFLKPTLPVTPAADALLLARLAGERGIPWQVVSRSRFLRIGLGPQSRIFKGTESTLTSSIGVKIAKDKSMSNRLLSEAGLPVPKQRTARTEQAAVAAGAELGYPLVVKPLDGNMGRDVTIGVSSEEEMRKAFARAVSQSDRAVIETLIPGEEMRLLVANGKVLSVDIRQPAHVVGDGTHTVAELVQEENKNPERDAILTGSYALMKPLQLDEDALSVLAQQGLTADSVPEAGTWAYLRRESNVSRGGSSVDVTEKVHPSIRQVAEAASRTLRLDVCGVDFVTTDMTKPWQETGGAICEVNSRPGLHGQMSCAPEDRQGFILESAFNALVGSDYRNLPVVALVGAPEATARMRQTLETLAQRSGRKLGIVGEATGLAASSQALETVTDLFQADDINAAVIVMKPRDLLEQGLGLPRVAAAVMPQNLGPRTAAVRRVLERVAGDAVLTADDPATTSRAAAALELPEMTKILPLQMKT